MLVFIVSRQRAREDRVLEVQATIAIRTAESNNLARCVRV